jgi:hypothetical protein
LDGAPGVQATPALALLPSRHGTRRCMTRFRAAGCALSVQAKMEYANRLTRASRYRSRSSPGCRPRHRDPSSAPGVA